MPHQLFVAPESRGDGTGLSPADAADYRDFESPDGFWKRTVADLLELGSVSVSFAGGTYARGQLFLESVGHGTHTLVLHGAPDHSTVFWIAPGDAPKSNIFCRRCTNLVFRYFRFTGAGEIDYVLRFRSGCTYMAIDRCLWEELPNVGFGATGVTDAGTSHVTYTDCIFRRVGPDSHAHMMYHAHDAHHVTVSHCIFEDCAGDYVRFRDLVDHSSVVDCRFVSTGTYPSREPASRPFITMPLFNDCKPGSDDCPDPLTHRQYEYFGTHYVFARNTFEYRNHPGHGNPFAIAFEHYGHDPPGRNHLLTPWEGNLLVRGEAEERRMLLKANCGIDMDRVRVYSNQFVEVRRRFTFGSHVDYGAATKGWEGYANIDSLANADPGPDMRPGFEIALPMTLLY
ncbi:MAG: hypothetical protein AAGD06_27000 [Acidobacteriota bacterium]